MPKTCPHPVRWAIFEYSSRFFGTAGQPGPQPVVHRVFHRLRGDVHKDAPDFPQVVHRLVHSRPWDSIDARPRQTVASLSGCGALGKQLPPRRHCALVALRLGGGACAWGPRGVVPGGITSRQIAASRRCLFRGRLFRFAARVADEIPAPIECFPKPGRPKQREVPGKPARPKTATRTPPAVTQLTRTCVAIGGSQVGTGHDACAVCALA